MKLQYIRHSVRSVVSYPRSFRCVAQLFCPILNTQLLRRYRSNSHTFAIQLSATQLFVCAPQSVYARSHKTQHSTAQQKQSSKCESIHHLCSVVLVVMYMLVCVCVSECATNRISRALSLCHFLSEIILKSCTSNRSKPSTPYSVYSSHFHSLIHCLVVLSVVLVCFSFFLCMLQIYMCVHFICIHCEWHNELKEIQSENTDQVQKQK